MKTKGRLRKEGERIVKVTGVGWGNEERVREMV